MGANEAPKEERWDMYAKKREFFTLEDFEVGEVTMGVPVVVNGREFMPYRVQGGDLASLVGNESFVVLFPTTADNLAQDLLSSAKVAASRGEVSHVREYKPTDEDVGRLVRMWGAKVIGANLPTSLELLKTLTCG